MFCANRVAIDRPTYPVPATAMFIGDGTFLFFSCIPFVNTSVSSNRGLLLTVPVEEWKEESLLFPYERLGTVDSGCISKRLLCHGEFFTVRGYKVRQDGGGEFFHDDFLSGVIK